LSTGGHTAEHNQSYRETTSEHSVFPDFHHLYTSLSKFVVRQLMGQSLRGTGDRNRMTKFRSCSKTGAKD
jgi:hypothetical protein